MQIVINVVRGDVLYLVINRCWSGEGKIFLAIFYSQFRQTFSFSFKILANLKRWKFVRDCLNAEKIDIRQITSVKYFMFKTLLRGGQSKTLPSVDET